MSARVRVRAVIWVSDRIAVHETRRGGRLRLTLPGGRVREREGVVEALIREVGEELALDIEVGELLFAAEVRTATSRHDLELVFEARPKRPVDTSSLALIDPENAPTAVFPPVLEAVVHARRSRPSGVWLGNVYDRELPSA